MKKIFLLIIILTCSSNCTARYPYKPGLTADKNTTIFKYQNYYKININLDPSKRENIFKNYMQLILKICPDYEKLLDSYLAECSAHNEYIYELFLENTEKIWPGIHKQYQKELKTMGSLFKKNPDLMNDSRLSEKEFYTLNLLPDAGRTTACSSLIISKELSKNNQLMVGRSLEWFGGTKNQLSRLHSITTITNKNSGQSVTLVGYLGMLSCITGFNNKGLFLGIIDSSLGDSAVSVTNKNSYVFDTRHALEKYKDSKAAAEFLRSNRRSYTFNHLIISADTENAYIVENNITDNKRFLRTFGDNLNADIDWSNKQAICAVNSFVKKGNTDNHTDTSYNYKRWNNYNDLLTGKIKESQERKISVSSLQDILSYNSFLSFGGNIYSKSMTQHSLIYIPAAQKLYFYFKPQKGAPEKPDYREIKFKNFVPCK